MGLRTSYGRFCGGASWRSCAGMISLYGGTGLLASVAHGFGDGDIRRTLQRPPLLYRELRRLRPGFQPRRPTELTWASGLAGPTTLGLAFGVPPRIDLSRGLSLRLQGRLASLAAGAGCGRPQAAVLAGAGSRGGAARPRVVLNVMEHNYCRRADLAGAPRMTVNPRSRLLRNDSSSASRPRRRV